MAEEQSLREKDVSCAFRNHEVQSLPKPSKNENAFDMKNNGSMGSLFAKSCDSSSFFAMNNSFLSMSDSCGSLASRDSVFAHSTRKGKKPTTIPRSGADPINAISARLQQRLRMLEQRKSLHASSNSLDLEVILAVDNEDDEESQTGEGTSFASLESEFDAEDEIEHEKDEVNDRQCDNQEDAGTPQQ